MLGTLTKLTREGRGVAVYAPPSYKKGEARYPVVYIHDGGYLAFDRLNGLEHQFQTGGLPETIIVGIEPIRRNDDYTPWPAASLADGFQGFGGQGDAYLDFLTTRLKPWVDESYRTKPDAAHTMLCGASLGGLISLYAAYRCPGVFGRIGALSSSLWYEHFVQFLEERALPQAELKLYMYVGSLEGAYKTNRQRDMLAGTERTFRLLQAQGLGEDRLRFVVAEGATHDKFFFVQQFPEALRWLLGP